MEIDREELKKLIIKSIEDETAVYILNFNRQVEIHTCMYKWWDGSYHDEPEEEFIPKPMLYRKKVNTRRTTSRLDVKRKRLCAYRK